VHFTRRGRKYRGWFADHGDAKAALARAIEWRDGMLRWLPPPRLLRRSWPANTTGVVGVFVVPGRCGDSRGRRYAAAWTDEHGRRHRKSFSVSKYGATQARRLAVELRRGVVERLLRPPGADQGDPRKEVRRAFADKDRVSASLPPVRFYSTSSRNRSGTVGVHLHGSGTKLKWIAEGREHGRRRTRSFSVAKHGHARARALAIRARKAMVASGGQARGVKAAVVRTHPP
jgi:hypothetical protein